MIAIPVKPILLSAIIFLLLVPRLRASDIVDLTTSAEVYLSDDPFEKIHNRDFQKPKDGKLFFGYSHKAGWIRLKILNSSGSEKNAVIDIPANFNLNKVILYPAQGEPIYRGDHFQERDNNRIISFGHTFPVSLAPGENIFHLYVSSSDFVNLTINLFGNREDYLNDATSKSGFFLIFLTMTVTMIVYSSFLLSALREQKYLYYILYHLFTSYTYYYKAGFFQNIISYPWNWLADLWAPFTHLSIVFAHFFITKFLSSTINRDPRRSLVFIWLNRAYFVSTISYLVKYEVGILTSTVLLFIAATSALYAIYLGLKENRVENYLFALSWVFVIISATLYTLGFIGLIQPSFLSNNLMILGGGIEALISGFAIGIQVHRIRHQKVFAFEQFQKMVFPHQIIQIGSGVSLTDTMPVGAGNAFVISLDIEKSSQIMHARRKEFLEKFMEKCQKIIDENYNPEDRTANAYTIKGVGDGFLCSVGFPFEAPKGLNAADHTIDLAVRFVQVFNAEVNSLDYVEPIYCSVGISHGGVEGYFSKGNVLHYDLYGHAIVTAARYEGLRKALYKSGLSNNVLILQKTVYRSLSSPKRTDFEEINLIGRQIVVRDDPGADKAYTLEISKADQKIVKGIDPINSAA